MKSLGKILVIGSGPYSIGSSVEFDWSLVQCLKTLRKNGFETIMINSNPETVSTDFNECDKLYFEELTLERILDICEIENVDAVVVSMGGQVPNNLSSDLHDAGIKILGTSSKNINHAEDRNKFSTLLDELEINQPRWKEFKKIKDASDFANEVKYPVLVRPSFVLSGAAMKVANNEKDLIEFLNNALDFRSNKKCNIVISKFEENAKEIEFDAVAKNGKILIYAISEHIENAGTHSGDATIVFPPQKLYLETIRKIKKLVKGLAKKLEITGPFNIQFLARDNDIKVIELNLRASRSFPFVSKVSKENFIEIATNAMIENFLQENKKVVFLSGTSGSGKTTISNFIKNDAFVIHGDEIKKKLFGEDIDYIWKDKKKLDKVHDEIIKIVKEKRVKIPVIVDYILNKDFLKKIKNKIKCNYEIKILHPKKSEIIFRDKKRTTGNIGKKKVSLLFEEFEKLKKNYKNSFLDTTDQNANETYKKYFEKIFEEKKEDLEKRYNTLDLDYLAIKAPQFSFSRLQGADPISGVEMASTGEVACFGECIEEAFLKSMISVGFKIPKKNIVLSTGSIESKVSFLKSAKILINLKYNLFATSGTAKFLNDNKIKCKSLSRPSDKKSDCITNFIKSKKSDLVINIPKNHTKKELTDGYYIRRTSIDTNIPLITNIQVAIQFVKSIKKYPSIDNLPIQSYDFYKK